MTAKKLTETNSENLPKVVFSNVKIEDLPAMIPEMSQLTGIVEQTAYGT